MWLTSITAHVQDIAGGGIEELSSPEEDKESFGGFALALGLRFFFSTGEDARASSRCPGTAI
jgi:hypothetical protein